MVNQIVQMEKTKIQQIVYSQLDLRSANFFAQTENASQKNGFAIILKIAIIALTKATVLVRIPRNGDVPGVGNVFPLITSVMELSSVLMAKMKKVVLLFYQQPLLRQYQVFQQRHNQLLILQLQ